MREVHEGTCRNHSGVKSLVRKLIRAGYYWNEMEKDAKDFVRKCNECQRHAPMIYQPGEMLHPVLFPWPFLKLGMDIVGPLPLAPGKAQYILLMTDYFSKILYEIACDNRKQFIGGKSSTGVTPFSLVYDAEAMIPVEVGELSLSFQYATETSNDEAMATRLDLLDKRREAALVQLVAQKQLMGRYYNRRANLRHF
nr:uncharacterized protein LOC117280274 [Nicotiana tomentosiformis]